MFPLRGSGFSRHHFLQAASACFNFISFVFAVGLSVLLLLMVASRFAFRAGSMIKHEFGHGETASSV